MDHIGVEAITARRQRRQGELEIVPGLPHGVKMGEGVEARLPDQKKVHQLAVVRHQGRPLGAALVGDGEGQHRPARLERRRGVHLERLIDVGLRLGVDAVPPDPALPQRHREEDRSHGARDPCLSSAALIGNLARRQAAFPHAGDHQGDRAREQEQPQGRQHRSHSFLHSQHLGRHGGDGHHDLANTGRSGHVHPHAVGGAHHQPELGAPHAGGSGHRHGLVRRRRAFRAGLPLNGLGAHLGGLRLPELDGDLRQPRNHQGRTDDDPHGIGAGRAVVEDVGAAHVRPGRCRRQQQRQHGQETQRRLQRCTLDNATPRKRPRPEETTDSARAVIKARSVIGSRSSRTNL